MKPTPAARQWTFGPAAKRAPDGSTGAVMSFGTISIDGAFVSVVRRSEVFPKGTCLAVGPKVHSNVERSHSRRTRSP